MSQKARILVVDDEPRGVELAVRTLRRLGSIETAISGEAAWGIFQQREVDAVVSDERMPGISGVELLARVAEARPDVGRVLLTGYADIDASVDAINRARVHAYVNKPCSPTQLRATVQGVLERVDLARANALLVADLAAKNEELAQKNQELEDTLDSLHVAQQAVVESERLAAIGGLAASIVHDFRGPLTVISFSGRELGADAEVAADELREMAGQIVEESDRMTRMCAELLEVTRFSAGHPKRVEDDLDEVIESALAALSHDASVAGVEIVTDLRSRVRFPVDEDRFRRIILNLGYNAIEAMPEGGVLEVGSKLEGDQIVVSVRDSGIGIPEDVRDHLFEPFATAGKANGSGLGLAIVKKVVREHDGSIDVEKAEGGGTEFRLRFRLDGGG
jgi:signal transduction histidine kinase